MFVASGDTCERETLCCAGAVRSAVEPMLSGDAPRRRGRPRSRSPRSSSPAAQTHRRQQRSPAGAGAGAGACAGTGPHSSLPSSASSSSNSLSDTATSNGTCADVGAGVEHENGEACEQHAEKQCNSGGGRWTAVMRLVHRVINSHSGGFGLLLFIFTCYLLALVGVYLVFPEMRRSGAQLVCAYQSKTYLLCICVLNVRAYDST